MTKCIVETTGEFGLVNNDYSAIHSHRPTVTRKTQLVEIKIAERQLRMLASTLPDQANDEDFYKVWLDSDKDAKLAVAAYCGEFGVDAHGDEIETENDPAKEAAEKAAAEAAAKQAEEEEAARKAQEEADAKEAAEKAEKDAADKKAAEDAAAKAAADKEAADKKAAEDLKNQLKSGNQGQTNNQNGNK